MYLTVPHRLEYTVSQWRAEGGGGGGWVVQTAPPLKKSEILTKLSRIPNSVENTSVTT
jgi:galactokinase/mevalonate kinase-like predicted kinase